VKRRCGVPRYATFKSDTLKLSEWTGRMNDLIRSAADVGPLTGVIRLVTPHYDG